MLTSDLVKNARLSAHYFIVKIFILEKLTHRLSLCRMLFVCWKLPILKFAEFSHFCSGPFLEFSLLFT